MKVDKKEFIKILDENFDDEIELVIGSGKREYPVDEIMGGILGSKIVFATSGYANWKRKKQMVV